MNSISLNDFARFAAAHDHGEFVIRTADDAKTLDRHIVCHTSSQANLEARQALFAAITQSGLLDGIPGELEKISRDLGLGDVPSPTRFKPLKLREVRVLIDDVHEKGMGGLQKLLELREPRFSPEEVMLLRQTMTQTELTDCLETLKHPENMTPAFVQDLKKKAGNALLAVHTQELIRNACEHRRWKPLAGLVLQHYLSTTRNPESFSPDLLIACLKRAVAQNPGLRDLQPGPEMVATLTAFIEGCTTNVQAILTQLNPTKENFRRMLEAQTQPFLQNLPEAERALAQEDIALFFKAELENLDSVASRDNVSPATLNILIADAKTRFQRGLHVLVSHPRPPVNASKADCFAARVRLFTEITFEMRTQHIFDLFNLRPANTQALHDKFCQSITLAPPVVSPDQDDQTPIKLRLEDLFSIEGKMENDLDKLYNTLKVLGACQSPSDSTVIEYLADALEEEGLQEASEAEFSAVKTVYAQFYVREMIPRCADPQLLEANARDLAIREIAQDAVRALKTAYEIAESIEQRLEHEPFLLEFRADQNVTDDMRAAFNDFEAQTLEWVRTELMRRPSGDVTDEARAVLKQKIDELVAARAAHLRRQVSHEKYQATRADFDRKIATVESTLTTFAGNLPPLRTRTTLNLRPGILSDTVPHEIDAIWEKACDDTRDRYGREPLDFEPELPRFEEGPFIKTCEKDIAAAWETRGTAFVKALEDLEQFLRASGLPEGVGLTKAALDAPRDEVTARLWPQVVDLIKDLHNDAFAGNLAAVEFGLNSFKRTVRDFIASSNRQTFGTTVRPEEQELHARVEAARTYTELYKELRQGHARVLSPDKGFNGKLFEEGCLNLRQIFAEDQEHFHTEAELTERMKQHYHQVRDLWTDLFVHVQERMRARVEPQVLGLTDRDAAEGSGHTTFALLFAQKSSVILDDVVRRAQLRMMAQGTALSDAELQAVNAELDATVDKTIQEALAPANEQQYLVQESQLKGLPEKLKATAEQIVDDMMTGLHLHHMNVGREMLIAQAAQWINVQMTMLMTPQPSPDDGVFHLTRYPEVDLPALQQALKDHLKTFARRAPRVEGP